MIIEAKIEGKRKKRRPRMVDSQEIKKKIKVTKNLNE